MTSALTGGCICGAVRYESRGEPKHSVICHCRQCQRISGSGHAAQFAVPAESTRIQGELHYYDLTADSGSTAHCGFCPNCGNPILKQTEGYREVLFFHASTLDDPSLFQPEMVVYHESAPHWDRVDPDLPRYNP